jgi:hypothetical protein
MVDCASEWWIRLIVWDFLLVLSILHFGSISDAQFRYWVEIASTVWNTLCVMQLIVVDWILLWIYLVARANFPLRSEKAIWDSFA